MNPLTSDDAALAADDLDSYLEAFESDQHALGPDSLAVYLPAADHPQFCAIAAEMVRVDLERRTQHGQAARLGDYRASIPRLFADPDLLSVVAFEEYRLRRRNGEDVGPEQLARAYSIDPASWPKLHGKDEPPAEFATCPGISEAGQWFDGFELVEELGRGAFGVVFLAKQQELSLREVVLKITPRRSVEAQRLAKLQHTNITPIYSMHTHGPWLGICMPFLGRRTLAGFAGPGARADLASTLANRLDETVRTADQEPSLIGAPLKPESPSPRVPSDENAAVEVVRQLAEGLAHAHARGIVHSDIKPANVLVGDDGVARLLDFNLAMDGDAADVRTLTVGGTLPYLAPEHLEALRNGSRVAAASDVYSLGVLLYELIVGRQPFATPVDTADWEAMAEQRRAFSSDQLSETPLSPSIRAVIASVLSPDPAKRYTAAALAEDLGRHLADRPLLHVREPLSRQSVRKWSRRNAAVLRGAGVFALAGAIALAVGLAANRGVELARLDAAQGYEAFQSSALSARLLLHAPGSEPECWLRGAERASTALSQFAGSNSPRRSRLTSYQLDTVERETLALQRLLREYEHRQQAGGVSSTPLGIIPDADSQDVISAAAGKVSAGDYESAIRLLDDMSGATASDPVRWLLLANSLAAEGRLPDAEAGYTALVALQPDAMAGYYYRGLARLQSGKFSLAADDFTAALERSPDTACLLLNRAVAYRGLGLHGAAEQDVSRAIVLDGTNPRAWLLRADLRQSLGNASGAADDVQEGLTRAPKDDLGWSARGMALLENSPEQAAAELRQGLSLFPESASLLKNLVHVLADRLDRHADARGYAQRLSELRPNDPSAQLSLAVLNARGGDVEAALRALPELHPETATPLEALQVACAYALLTQVDAAHAQPALRWLQASLRKEPRLCLRAAKDPDLAVLRATQEYRELMQASMRLSTTTPAGQRFAREPDSAREAARSAAVAP